MNEADALRLAQQIAARITVRLVAVLLEHSDQGRQVIIHLPPGCKHVRIQWPPDVDRIEAK